MFSNSVQSACVLTGGIAVQIQSESHIVNAPAFPPDSLGRGMPFIYTTVLQIESTLYPDFFYPIHYFNVNEEKVSGLPMNPATIGLMYIRSLPTFTPVLRFFIADVTIWYGIACLNYTGNFTAIWIFKSPPLIWTSLNCVMRLAEDIWTKFIFLENKPTKPHNLHFSQTATSNN